MKNAKNLLSYMVFWQPDYGGKIQDHGVFGHDLFFFGRGICENKEIFKDFTENQEVRIVLDHQVKPWDTVLALENAELPQHRMKIKSKL